MSYTLELTEPAQNDLRQLDIWLQEEALDELDGFAANPPLRRRRVGDLVLDFVRLEGADTHYVFITARLDEKQKVVRVKSIAKYTRRGN